MVNIVVVMQLASSLTSKCTCSHVLSKILIFQVSAQLLILENLEQFLLKFIDTKSKPPKSSEGAKPDTPEAARASKLECKIVTEIYVSISLIMKHG